MFYLALEFDKALGEVWDYFHWCVILLSFLFYSSLYIPQIYYLPYCIVATCVFLISH